MILDNTNKYFTMKVGEHFRISYDFTNDLATSETVATFTASIYNQAGTDKTASMLANANATSPYGHVTVTAIVGSDIYDLKAKGQTSYNSLYINHIEIEVQHTITLNTKIGDRAANSYVTLSEANTYIRNKYGHNTSWDSLDSDAKKRVLMEAADTFDNLNLVGDKYYDGQALSFPRDDHDIISGDVATPCTINSFKNSNLVSDTYMKYPTNYWAYGTIHVTAGTPLYDVRNVSLSNVTTGSVTVSENFSATPNTNTDFTIFVPMHEEVKNAQIEQALFLVSNVNFDSLSNYKYLGAEKVKIGDTDITFKKASSSKINISPVTKKLLGRWMRRTIRVLRA